MRLISLALTLFAFFLSATPSFAGGGPVEFFVNQKSVLSPGETYTITARVGSPTDPCKGCTIKLKLKTPDTSDSFIQKSDKTNEGGKVEATLTGNSVGDRTVYAADIIDTNGVHIPSMNTVLLKFSIDKGGSVNVGTSNVVFNAQNFYILVNGEKYTTENAHVNFHSDPGDPSYTTLELTWFENAVEMRMNMYFGHNPGEFWRLTEVRTYDGNSPGEWRYYRPTDRLGQLIQNSVGYPYINNGTVEFTSKHNSADLIHMENVRIQAFANLPRETQVTPYITPKEKPIVVPSIVQPTYAPPPGEEATKELKDKVASLEAKLAESQEKQSFLEERVNQLVSFIRRLFPFFR